MKQVHWTLPFASLDGNRYRIDIYDEVQSAEGIVQSEEGIVQSEEGWPIQLVGAGIDEGGPLTTDEDKSEDYFSPMRHQTGIIHIVNTSGSLSIYDLVPENNIDRPIVIWRLDSNSSPVEVVWQGFVSCRTFTQGYNDRPQQIDLNVNGMLSIMKDIDVPIERWMRSATMTFGNLIGSIMTHINELCDIDLQQRAAFIEYCYIPKEDKALLNYLINSAIYIDEDGLENETKTVYSSKGSKMADVIEDICKFMGWVAVDGKKGLFFIKDSAQQYLPLAPSGELITRSPLNIQTDEFASLNYAGVGHSISISQGAGIVSVNTGGKTIDVGIDIPKFPRGYNTVKHRNFLLTKGSVEITDPNNGTNNVIDSYLSDNDDAHSNIEFAAYRADMNLLFVGPLLSSANGYGATTRDMVMTQSPLFKPRTRTDMSNFDFAFVNRNTTPPLFMSHYAGAYYARWKHYNDYKDRDNKSETKEGIICAFFPGTVARDGQQVVFDKQQVGSIVTMQSKKPLSYNDGFLNLTIRGKALWFTSISMPGPGVAGPNSYGLTYNSDRESQYFFEAELKFGNLYWNGAEWTNVATRFDVVMNKDGCLQGYYVKREYNREGIIDSSGIDGYLYTRDFIKIPIDNSMSGYVTFKIWPFITTMSTQKGDDAFIPYITNVLFTEISIKHEYDFGSVYGEDTHVRTGVEYGTEDVSENVYSRRINTTYRDNTISVDSNISTMLHNKNGEGIIRERRTRKYVTEIDFDGISKRPEVELLNRLASYYKTTRRRIELEIKHRDDMHITLFTGYDGKTYLPLSESRNWGTGISTVQCFEVPE